MTNQRRAKFAATDSWEQSRLFINDKEVPPGEQIILNRGQPTILEVRDVPGSIKAISLNVVADGGVEIGASPELGEWVETGEGKSAWTINSGGEKSGRVSLVFLSREVDQPWEWACSVMSDQLTDELSISLGGSELPSGQVGYPARAVTSRLLLQPRAGSPVAGLKAVVNWGVPPTGLDVTLAPLPGSAHELLAGGTTWDLTSGNTKDGKFSLRVHLDDAPLSSIEVPLELGFHDTSVILSTIFKGTAGNQITLRTQSLKGFLPVSGVAVDWTGPAGLLKSGVTDERGFSAFVFKTGEQSGTITAQTYVRGERHSVKTVVV